MKRAKIFNGLLITCGLGSILLCSLLATGHLLLTPWVDLYLFNGDSLTLALFAKSLLSGEPLSWLFSSQIFVFPELFLYLICYVLAPSIEWSFVVNSLINLWLWGALIYLLSVVIGLTRLQGLIAAVISTAWVTLCVVLEPQPAVNVTALISLLLFNTYYFGVVLTAVAVAILTSVSINTDRQLLVTSSRRKIFVLSLSVALSALTYFSNPMFLLQCSIPLFLTLVLLRSLRKMSKGLFVWLVMSHLLALGLGQLLRYVFRDNIGRSTNRYIHLKSFAEGFEGVIANLRLAFASPHSALEYMSVGVLLVFSGWVALKLLRGALRDLRLGQVSELDSWQFALVFLSLSAWVTLVGTMMSGNFLMRYFLPVGVFPLLVLVYFYSTRNANHDSLLKRLATVLLMLVMPVALWSLSNVIESNSASFTWLSRPQSVAQFEPVQCYDRHMKKGHFNAVGSFWTSRALDTYGSSPSRILQVSETLEPVFWLINRASFQTTKINGVVVNRVGHQQTKVKGNINSEDVAELGQPATIFQCNDFDIYFYSDDSQGFKTLRRLVNGLVPPTTP